MSKTYRIIMASLFFLIAAGLISLVIGFIITAASLKKDADFPTSQSKWIITKIESNKNNTSLYFAMPIDSKNLNTQETWLVDSTGKFNTGDTIYFSK